MLVRLVVVVGFCSLLSARELDLRFLEWSFSNDNGSLNGVAAIPGDIFSDLLRNFIISDPYFGRNDQALAWVGKTEWIYSANLTLPSNWLHPPTANPNVLIVFEGLDTVADVYFNDKRIGSTFNQFRTYHFPIDYTLLAPNNNITVRFKSPVEYAASKFDEYVKTYGDQIPPVEPTVVQHGQSHPNFIRKTQSSFSWDWGPSFPTVGFYGSVKFLVFDELFVTDMSPLAIHQGQGFNLTVDIIYYCALSVRVSFSGRLILPEIGLERNISGSRNCSNSKGVFPTSLFVGDDQVKRWNPRGYGEPQLYRLTLELDVENKSVVLTKEIGFRTVQLNTDLVKQAEPELGRRMEFIVNGVPIFLKGANFIPASLFPRDFSRRKTKFLFRSMLEANMNTLRVWGGGEWLREEFFEMADQFGILVFHDLTFACALYPTDPNFLRNIKAEIEEQVYRIRSHPSLLVIGGNNELEAAIRQHWYMSFSYNEDKQVRDYVKLMQVALDAVRRTYPGGLLLRSSPSNGFLNLSVDLNPNDPAYGDVHFYNELINLWRPSELLTPRCATEFGVPSIPLKTTMMASMSEADYNYFSKTMMARNHHPMGFFTLPFMTIRHFTPSASLSSFSFLTQAHQALALRTQIEHYRRSRSSLNADGHGLTMCALYWQLNDVWAGVSWSTMDVEQRWKVGHYHVKEAFQPLLLSMFFNKHGQFEVFVVSDLTQTAAVRVNIQLIKFGAGFAAEEVLDELVTVSALSSQKVSATRNSVSGPDDYFLIGWVKSANATGTGLLVPNYMPAPAFSRGAFVKVRAVRAVAAGEFLVELHVSEPLPFVWVDFVPTLQTDQLRYHFDRNGFFAARSNETLRLFVFYAQLHQLKPEHLNACWLYSC